MYETLARACKELLQPANHDPYPGYDAGSFFACLPVLVHDGISSSASTAQATVDYVLYNTNLTFLHVRPWRDMGGRERFGIYCGSMEDLEALFRWMDEDRSMFPESDVLETFRLWQTNYMLGQ